jgi:hypothetical protein
MLDQMENALWFGEGKGEGHSKKGALADKTFQAVLKVLLKQEGLNCGERNETGTKKLKDLLKVVGDQFK